MTEALAKHFMTEDFKSENFVKNLNSQCVGVDELKHQRAKIQELSDNISALLKQNVYQNYIQFIDTAKEISHLESEMYQLSQLLSEQRSLLSVLATNRNANILFEENLEFESKIVNFESKDEESKQKLIKLLENVEGAMSLIETPGRICLHEGSLLELDPVEGTPIKRVHAYLFNDVLMIASWLSTHNRRGPPRYRMQVVYDLQSLAIVNVKDLGSVKLAFKLLVFPETRVFQCATITSKKEWLEKCDQAKKLKIFQEIQKLTNIESSPKQLFTPSSRSLSLESDVMGNEVENEADLNEILPEWILEVTEDLDSYIAQRYFEEAYNLLEKAKNFIRNRRENFLLRKMKIEFTSRATYLVNILITELESSIEIKSLHGGDLRTVRKAVKLLIQLDCSTQACQLYLKLCSAVFKLRLKRVKKEGATIPYIKLLSVIAFRNIIEISQEFYKIFSYSTNCSSALVIWCNNELKNFTLHFIKQILVPQVSLNTIVECISTIHDQCEQLAQMGIDFRNQLNGHLRIPLSKALQDIGEKYIESTKVRAIEDTWRQSNFEAPKNLYKVLSELDDLGISVPKSYIISDKIISLTNNTLIFSKLFIGLLEDCLSVCTPEISNIIEKVLLLVLQAEVQHLKISISNPKLKKEKKLVQDNAKYIQEVVIVRTLELYKSVMGHEFSKLQILQGELYFDLTNINKPQPTPRTSITKYSSVEYI